VQLEGLFDIPRAAESSLEWTVNLSMPEEWSIGLIVGPSGCGKTTIAEEFFPLHRSFEWPAGKSVVDAFPQSMPIKEIVGILSSVGFSSPPAWLRPFHVLSNGEQFRVSMARVIAEATDVVAVDEFTSVVDRTVARIGSCAIANAIRKNHKRFVAVSCHYDIVDWLQPDWMYEPHTETFSRRSLRRRPDIVLEVRRVRSDIWSVFKKHHYLSHDLMRASKCYAAFVDGRPAAFTAVRSFAHAHAPGWAEHRTVCLPDFQGVGIGNALSDFVAAMYSATGKPYRSVTSHPAMIYRRAKSLIWHMTRRPSHIRDRITADKTRRLTASFLYIGPADLEAAREFGIITDKGVAL
jgi:hypothetical protein